MDLFAEPADVSHGLGILFQDISKVLGLDGDGTSHELRDVVTLQQLTVMVRIGTRQFEGLAATTIGIDMGNEWTGVVAVVAAAAEDDPLAVARPGVVTLSIL